MFFINQPDVLQVQLQVFKKDYSNKFQPFLINVVLNVCDLFSKRSFMPYGLMILKVAKQFSNFNHSCPFSGHLLARDAYLPDSSFPNFFPLGKGSQTHTSEVLCGMCRQCSQSRPRGIWSYAHPDIKYLSIFNIYLFVNVHWAKRV